MRSPQQRKPQQSYQLLHKDADTDRSGFHLCMFVLLRSALSVVLEERRVLCSKHAKALLQLMQSNRLSLHSSFDKFRVFCVSSPDVLLLKVCLSVKKAELSVFQPKHHLLLSFSLFKERNVMQFTFIFCFGSVSVICSQSLKQPVF